MMKRSIAYQCQDDPLDDNFPFFILNSKSMNVVVFRAANDSRFVVVFHTSPNITSRTVIQVLTSCHMAAAAILDQLTIISQIFHFARQLRISVGLYEHIESYI